jgi:hypothetical protein
MITPKPIVYFRYCDNNANVCSLIKCLGRIALRVIHPRYLSLCSLDKTSGHYQEQKSFFHFFTKDVPFPIYNSLKCELSKFRREFSLLLQKTGYKVRGADQLSKITHGIP